MLEHWTYEDFQNGLCAPDQVGKPKAPPPSPVAPTQFASLADATEQAFQRLGGEAFFTWAEENPRAFFDLAAKHGFAQLVKQAPKEVLPTPDQLTDARMRELSLEDLTKILLKANGIQSDGDLDNALRG